MVLVKTKLGMSKTHGVGLFADQFIPKGAKTYQYTPGIDIDYSEADLAKMSEPARKQVLWYAYMNKEGDKYILCADDYRFINHSQNPVNVNIEATPDRDIAARDIKKGEE